MTFDGRTALVTGGSSGIGLATARILRDQGARVAITGRSAQRLAAARRELGEEVLAIRADVSSLADLAGMRAALEGAFAPIDIVFANAGVALGTPLATADEATYNAIMDTNVKGVFFTVQAVLPLMRDGGSIILNTSWLNQVGTPGRAILSASKAAVRSFARTMSAELLDRKIRVNAVSPGMIDTAIQPPGRMERILPALPQGRAGTAEEVAEAILFLLSDAASYVNGTNLRVSGAR